MPSNGTKIQGQTEDVFRPIREHLVGASGFVKGVSGDIKNWTDRDMEEGPGETPSLRVTAVKQSEARIDPRPKRILAVASGGGHWVQLMRISSAFVKHEVAYVTVSTAYRCDVKDSKLYSVVDATAWNKFKLIWQALQVLLIVLRERPEVIISTGAALGYFAIRFGKLLGARTIWIDSIANVERLSMSGRNVKPYADLWLTQWQHLTLDSGPLYHGAVL